MFAYGRFPTSEMYYSCISKGVRNLRAIFMQRSKRMRPMSRMRGDAWHARSIIFENLQKSCAMPRSAKEAITMIASAFADGIATVAMLNGSEPDITLPICNTDNWEFVEGVLGEVSRGSMGLTIKRAAQACVLETNGAVFSKDFEMVVKDFMALSDGMKRKAATGTGENREERVNEIIDFPDIVMNVEDVVEGIADVEDIDIRRAIITLVGLFKFDEAKEVLDTKVYEGNLLLEAYSVEEYEDALAILADAGPDPTVDEA